MVTEPAAPKSALGSASRAKSKAAAPVKKPQAPKAEAPKQEAPKAEPAKTEAPKKEQPKKEKQPRQPKAEKKVEEPKEVKEYAPAEPGSVEEKIETFLKGLLEHMGSKAVPHCWKADGNTY